MTDQDFIPFHRPAISEREIAAAVDVLRSGELERLRVCAAPDCDAAVLDLSRNRSKLYCATGNCANREHVRAYRQRQAANRS